MCADVTVRPLGPDHHADSSRVVAAAFGNHPDPALDEQLGRLFEPGRRLGAFAGDRLVGSASAFSFGLTVPGGDLVPVAGVTAVGVAATHRRRGIMRSMMAAQLDDVAARGEPAAVLTASESGIYRRFGYGAATFNATYELDPRRARFRQPVGDDLDLHLVDGDTALAEAPIPAIYERWRAGRPGTFRYGPEWWRAVLGSSPSYLGGGPCFVVWCGPGAGHGGGFAVYTTAPGREFDLQVSLLVATDPVVEARLWRYVLEVDLVDRVRVDRVPVDGVLRWWLTDPRQVGTVRLRDWLHLRLLDVPAALAARRYPADGDLVVEVSDGFRPGPATDGRFALAVTGGEGRCEPTSRPADLVLDVAELGSLYLGGVRAGELARAGLVTQRTPGALDRADALFGWPVAPFCPTSF